jgi:hypothetical protein
MTCEARALTRLRRALDHGHLWAAEDAARELPNVSLEDALTLVRLYGEKDSPKYEKAALRWLARYLEEAEPSLDKFAKLASGLARQAPDA